MPDRVLLLSYCFPPMWPPEAVLSAKRMANLPGFTVDVICSAPFGQWSGDDHSLDRYVEERFGKIERLTMPDWAKVARRFELLVRSPDEFRFLNRSALSSVRSRSLRRYAAIVTWSQFHSVHLVGLATRRLPEAPPWLAHFSDPWNGNPLDPMSGLRARVNRRLERKVIEGASSLIFTSSEARNLCTGQFANRASAKSEVLPHAFEPALYPEVTGPRLGQFTFRYIGQFYGARTPEPLFRGLHLLGDRDRAALRGVRVELIGRVEDFMLQSEAARTLPEHLLRAVPPVDYVESLKLAREADLLLVIDAPMSSSPFLPSKLIDYLGAERPVLGITPRGPAATLIRRFGGWVADPQDPEAIAAALVDALEYLRSHRDRQFGDASVRAEYSAVRVGARMGELIRNLSSRAPPEARSS
jgi:hypothetical protein